MADALANLDALVKQLPGMLERAMAYTALWMENEAKGTTAFKDQSGNLRNSIQGGARVANDVAEGFLSAGYPGFGASMEYAARIELGFVGTDKAGRNINQAPRPFIQPAVEAAAAQAVFEEAFESELKKVLG